MKLGSVKTLKPCIVALTHKNCDNAKVKTELKEMESKFNSKTLLSILIFYELITDNSR